ncbi:Phosphoglycerate dehydrogenase [Bertholletia excelsa]
MPAFSFSLVSSSTKASPSSSSLLWTRAPSSSVPTTATRRCLPARRVIVWAMNAKPTILVAEKIGDAGLEFLKGFANVDCSYNMSAEELCAKISLRDALIVRSGTKVTREVFESAGGRLKVVGRAGVGIDNVDLSAATEHGCLVLNAPTANTIAAAEHGIALLTSMARNIAQANASFKAGKWQRSKYFGVSLEGKTLLAMGFGKVGSEVARRAKGLGMQVIAYDPYAPADRARAIGVELAALDVFTEEPPPKDSSLVLHENVTVTPHLGASTIEAQEGVAIEIAEAVVGALKGDLAATAVNAPMVPPEVLSELAPYVSLAEKLGRLAVQLVAGGKGVQTVKITFASTRDPDDLDTRLLRAMVIKGILEPISSVFVNLVNADFIAKLRGLRITEERIPTDGSREKPIEFILLQLANVESRLASAISETGEIQVQGMVKEGLPHLTMVGPFEVDVSLEGSLILCKQVDQPGIIGKVGNIMGKANVNVNFMSVGRIAALKQAVMTIGVDEEPDAETLKKIGETPAIEEFVFLKL